LEDTVRLPALPSLLSFLSPLRRLPVLAAAAVMILALGGAVAAVASSSSGRAGPRQVAPPRMAAAGSQAAGNPGSAGADEFAKTANPLTLDQPLQVPPVKPTVVMIANHAAFGNAPRPATTTLKLPGGHWSEVVLDVTGTESGTQYDRLCEIFDGPTQIFLGVTPEPTPAGITWHLQKDITGYLPLLSGKQTFSTYIDNYLSATDNGIPVITAKLLFYPAGRGFSPAQPAGLSSPGLAGDAVNETGPAASPQHPQVPTDIVPILPHGAKNTFKTINAGQTVSARVTLPTDITTATLDLYAVGQIDDEFWWAENPAFREIEITIDGKPAGVVWPYPYVYTGGVNPLIWRPITGIHTMDIPSYRLDLTPFAGMLGGTHTIGVTVVNNTGYWLGGGSLLLGTGGQTTSGSVTADTLSFPTTSHVVTKHALGSPNEPVTSESASASYQVSGQVTQGGRTWTDTLSQKLQFGDDESNIQPSCNGVPPCYEWVQGEETQSSTESVSGPGVDVNRSDDSNWTINAPNGYQQNKPGNAGTAFFLPASVSQQLTDVASQQGGFFGGYQTRLSESIIGYGSLAENSTGAPIVDGDTTGTITAQASGWPGGGYLYERTVVARGGHIVQNLVQSPGMG
jgi:Peptide N-acetyl-beta-D-glucosaminyl asparaginase amidase A